MSVITCTQLWYFLKFCQPFEFWHLIKVVQFNWYFVYWLVCYGLNWYILLGWLWIHNHELVVGVSTRYRSAGPGPAKSLYYQDFNQYVNKGLKIKIFFQNFCFTWFDTVLRLTCNIAIVMVKVILISQKKYSYLTCFSSLQIK